MESDKESFNLEDLPMFLNSVLEKAELICREENVDSSAVENRQCKNISLKRRLRTATAYQGNNTEAKGKMQNEDHKVQSHCRPGGK